MANTILTIDDIAREALMLLRSTLVGVKLFDRRYETNFTGTEMVGDTIRIRRRGSGTVREFTSSITVDDITESNVNLVLEKHYDLSFAVTSKQWTLDLQNFSEQLLAPNVLKMAEQIDAYALTKLKHLPNIGGTGETSWNGSAAVAPGALPTTIAHLAAINRKLDEQKVPMAERVQLVSPAYKQALLSIDSFVEADKRGDGGTALAQARMGQLMSMSHFMDQNVDSSTVHTSGTMSTAALSAEVAVGATSIPYDTGNLATGTWKTGDIVYITGYGNVVVAADNTAVSNAGTLTIVEPIRTAIADTTVMTMYDPAGTRTLQGAAFNPRAFAFAAVPLEIPEEASGAVVTYEDLSIRLIRDYNITTKTSTISMDCLVGGVLVDGNLGCQVVLGT
jgi:hypothetical protein